MSGLVCPWWLAFVSDNPLRRLFHKPEEILAPYVRTGMTVADLGCGMGYFSLDLARLVGGKGTVLSVDLQEQMLTVLRRRAVRARLAERIIPVLADATDLHLDREIDFALAFWMVHETPSAYGFFEQIERRMSEAARVLVAEPWVHVKRQRFLEILEDAGRAGLRVLAEPSVFFSRTALLVR